MMNVNETYETHSYESLMEELHKERKNNSSGEYNECYD
jgi:hypothetical protein